MDAAGTCVGSNIPSSTHSWQNTARMAVAREWCIDAASRATITPPELSFSSRVGLVKGTPDHLLCPRMTMPSYIALAMPWDSASVEVMA